MRHVDYMQLALAEAARAEAAGDVPVGAIVVQAGQVIARGHNTREAERDPCGHAELNAIRTAARVLNRWRLADCTLYVTLEPCPMCAAALSQSRLERLVFGAQDARQGAAGTVWELTAEPRLGHRIEVIAGVLEDACREQLLEFFAKRRS